MHAMDNGDKYLVDRKPRSRRLERPVRRPANCFAVQPRGCAWHTRDSELQATNRIPIYYFQPGVRGEIDQLTHTRTGIPFFAALPASERGLREGVPGSYRKMLPRVHGLFFDRDSFQCLARWQCTGIHEWLAVLVYRVWGGCGSGAGLQ